MAGLGRKVFTRETLGSAELNGYLMDQAVMRFASASARAAAIPSPSQGMVTYLDSTKRVEHHDGTAWRDATAEPQWSVLVQRPGTTFDSYSGRASLLAATWESAPAGEYLIDVTLATQANAPTAGEAYIVVNGTTLTKANTRADTPADAMGYNLIRVRHVHTGGDLAVTFDHLPNATVNVYNSNTQMTLQFLGRRTS